MLMLACGGDNSAPDAIEPAPAEVIVPVAPAKALANATRAVEAPEEGWGAVFWRSGQAWKVGGGNIVASALIAREAPSSGDANICGGVALKGAIPKAAVALPEGAAVPEITKTPAIRAHLVERAAWRLDEVLPPRDKYSPAVTNSAPSEQRGVSVGSVAKTRRHGAPPILLATGVRDCTAAVAVVDAETGTLMAQIEVGGVAAGIAHHAASQRLYALVFDQHQAVAIDVDPDSATLHRIVGRSR